MKNILRNFWITLTRFKMASILNILGLTVAFTVFMIIMSQTYWELTYNRDIKQHEQIFRLSLGTSAEIDPKNVYISRLFGETIGTSSAVVEAYSPIFTWSRAFIKTTDMQGQKHETKSAHILVSPNITELLSFESLLGDFKRLQEPNAAIIPQSLANLLFPNEYPIDNSIIFPKSKDTLHVVAVYKDLPNNCSFENGVYSNIGDFRIHDEGDWSFIYYYKLYSSKTKLEFEKQAKAKVIEMIKQTNAIDNNEHDNELNDIIQIFLEPISNLYYSAMAGNSHFGNRTLTNLLITIAIIIILIAVINYINFFMALVPIRIRSVNINKVFGTSTAALRLNIMGEAVGLLLLSFVLALLLVQCLSDTFISGFIDSSLKIKDNLFIISTTGILMMVTGALAGLFPAFYITKFNPALVLKGSFGRSKQGQRLRSALIIFQFVISIILIICVFFVYLQNRYLQKYDYGFHRDCLITVEVGEKIASQPQAFLSELRKNPSIESIAYADRTIVDVVSFWTRTYNGEKIGYYCLPVSWNYPEFMGLKLVEGRFFTEDDNSKNGTFIFNEIAAKKYNIKVGDFLLGHNEPAEIVGIVKDFNFNSLKYDIEPLALYEFGYNAPRVPSVAHIRLTSTANFKQVAALISLSMQEITPSLEADKIEITPFNATLESLYIKEINLAKIVSIFSLVAILISLMGVFCIVVFENQHRRKEIAVRKIHGATAQLILGMFNRKFIIILLISFAVAAPIAYFCVTKWLYSFAYRIPVYWWVFAGGFLIVAFITLLTVTLQTFSAANENPVKLLKTE